MLNITDLNIAYKKTQVVRDLSLHVAPGEIVGIVGESGSGKSTLIRSILGLLGSGGKVLSGQIVFEGREIQNLKKEPMRKIRGKEIAIVFQQPERSFDPTYRIENQFYESMRVHGDISKDEARKRAEELLLELNLPQPEQILKAYPFELSGGMCQRVAIAVAMAHNPRLLLADEPTSALDVTVQAQVVQVMMDLREKFDTSILIVTHNMGVVAYMADMVGVMFGGQMVEWGQRDEVLYDPRHPYTQQLIDAIPKMDGTLPVGEAGNPARLHETEGCAFRFRCKNATEECGKRKMERQHYSETHWSLCGL